MNLPDFFFSDGGGGGGGDPAGNRPSPRKELQLQGPRPAALKVNKDSHKIRKPPIAPLPHNHHHHHAPPQPQENRQPVIIYAVPPKIIHTTVNDYKSLVQRLTGNTTTPQGGASSPYGGAGVGNLSPAARLASMEKTSPPKEREPADTDAGGFTVGDFVWDTNVEFGALPGILSPAPGSLPPISPGFFLPAPGSLPPISPGFLSPANWDPFNVFIPSPSTLFTAPMVSPSPSSADLFNAFFDF